MYIRELPEPLLTFELYDAFLERAIIAFRMSFTSLCLSYEYLYLHSETHTDRRVLLRTMIDQLPHYNKCLLKRLMLCLHKVQEHSKLNKMTAPNLSKVFGPNLLIPPPNGTTLPPTHSQHRSLNFHLPFSSTPTSRRRRHSSHPKHQSHYTHHDRRLWEDVWGMWGKL